jgi:hypothetical protein
MRWVGHVVCIGERRGAHKVLAGRPDGKRQLENLVVDEMVIMKWIFKQRDGETLTGLIWLTLGTGGGRL